MCESHDVCHIITGSTVHYTQQRLPYIGCPQPIDASNVSIATNTKNQDLLSTQENR